MKHVLTLVMFCLLPAFSLRAQLVADGETNVIDGISTNLSVLTVSTNGAFTMLVLTNGAKINPLSSGALVTIGATSNANYNQFILTGSNSFAGYSTVRVGNAGSFNLLSITNGARLVNSSATIGLGGGSNNMLVVSGSNSTATGNNGLEVGFDGALSQLLVEKGAQLKSGSGRLGFTTNGNANIATVTGTGTVWTNTGDMTVGFNGPNNTMIVSDGASVFNNFGYVGTNSIGNTVIVTGTNSTWANRSDIYVGYASSSNQVVVTNGGVVLGTNCSVGASSGSSFNQAIITGAGSVWFCSTLSLGSQNSCNSNSLVILDGGKVILPPETGFARVGGRGNNNSLLVSGTGSAFMGSVGLGVFQGANNSLIISNGGILSGLAASIGGGNSQPVSNNKALVTGAGSRLELKGDLSVGLNQGVNNQLTVSNGATATASNLVVGFPFSASNCLVTVSSGALIVTNKFGTSLTIFRGWGCSLALDNALFITDTFNFTNKPGKLWFNGGLFQTRNTEFRNGDTFNVGDGTNVATLELLGNGLHWFVNGLRIANAATILGSGSIVANVTNDAGGTLNPGNGVGNLFIRGRLYLAAGSTNVFELNHGASTNDNITGVLTNVTYGGTLSVTNLSGTPTNGTFFKLFSASNYAGAFANFIADPPAPGLRWNLNRLSVDGVLRVVPAQSDSPVINSTTMLDATNLVISAAQGLAYDPVYLLSTTNLAAPLANWDCIATNRFDSSGNASFTNSINPDEPMRYFRLSVD